MKKLRLFLAACSLFAICGCSWKTQTIYVPHGQAVRLRETIHGAKVWIKTESGETRPGVVDLHEGWYCLPKGD